MDDEVEEAIEKVTLLLEEVNNLMDVVTRDVAKLANSLEELESIFQRDEDFSKIVDRLFFRAALNRK